MPAGLLSSSQFSSWTSPSEISQEDVLHNAVLPLSSSLSRGQRGRAATAFLETDHLLQPTRHRGRSSRNFSDFGAAQQLGSDLSGAKNAAKELEAETIGDSKKLEFTMRDSKKIYLCPDDVACCKADCNKKAIPDASDTSGASQGSAALASLGESGKQEADDCNKFCDTSFANCFPGDSAVVVRNRGKVALETLRVGDEVLSVRPASSGCGWEIFFDRVIAFLHREPHAECDFLRIRHELGQIHLSGEHLLFVKQASREDDESVPVPMLAQEVCVGDRVLAPWIDGNLTTPLVSEIETVRKQGLYAPLVESGAFLVDGTAASCYAVPEQLRKSVLYRGLTGVVSPAALQSLYHSLFLPLRIAARTVSELPKASEAKIANTDTELIHPYARVLYILFASTN